MITIRVEGMRELNAALGELKKSLQKPVMRRAALSALKPFIGQVRQLAPVAEVEGGALRDSYVIGTVAKLTPREKGKARREKDSEIEVYAGTSNPAGWLQELGTIYQRAQPHARPAWAMTRDTVLVTFQRDLKTQIDKTAARAAKRAARPPAAR